MSNNILHPGHYCEGRSYEPKDVIRDWDLNFNLGNVVKYISRAGRKGNALDDLRKAKTYLEFEIKHLENKTIKIKGWMGEPDPNVTLYKNGDCPRDPD